jgi:NADH-quinone oxidoreductase subunit N
MDLVRLILPELILIATACALFLLGVSSKSAARRAAPVIAILALLAAFAVEIVRRSQLDPFNPQAEVDPFNTFRITQFTHFIRMLVAIVSVMFALMFWPSDREATGNSALHFGADAGEFFALFLLSVAGVFLVAGADDMILLLLGIELASIPTYVMVSMSRPLAVAQEAGVKYFFLGAMSAALMLFGFSYLYGTTGTTSLRAAAQIFATTTGGTDAPVLLTAWQMLAVVLLIAGFAFKIAAVPLHVYAADVYQGAATPVTAMLSFIPKTSGMVALLKLLFVAGGGNFAVPQVIAVLLWAMAALTMTVGNVLGLLQFNVKRVLAYSSIAHSGYMLVGVTTLAFAAHNARRGMAQLVQDQALAGVLFYLAAYGIMNAGAFGVLMLLPARPHAHGFSRGTGSPPTPLPATSAETFEDLAGQGRNHPALGLAMAICCFSLIGLPLTVGFFGKVYLILPALRGGLVWLVVITMINAAISAAYYLKIVGTMFLRGEPAPGPFAPQGSAEAEVAPRALLFSRPVALAVVLSAVGTLLLGIVLPANQLLRNAVSAAAHFDERIAAEPARERTAGIALESRR